MKIERKFYLDQLVEGRHNGLIKIVTGIRRSGKSFLLFELFCDYLRETGIRDDHIIRIALDDRRFAALRNPDRMLEHIDARVKDDHMHYILLDEVQMMDEFVDVLNSLLHTRNVDVYVTGSNSRFLSKTSRRSFADAETRSIFIRFRSPSIAARSVATARSGGRNTARSAGFRSCSCMSRGRRKRIFCDSCTGRFI